MKKNVEFLLLDKRYLDKQLSQLPGVHEVAGVPGTKELPGLPGVKESDDGDEDDIEDEDECYCSKCGGKMKAKHDEPDADDAGGPSDDDADNMKKNEKSFFKTLVKRLFGGNIPKVEYSQLYSERDGVSVITVDGEIGKRLSEQAKMEGMVDVDDIAKAIRIAATADTKACLIHINSPGGCSIGIEECGEVIKNLTIRKPVFTFTDTICASAAYWLASCTNGIYATPSSELGSIGVYAKVIDYSENLKMNGINVQVFSAGEMKTMGQGDAPLSEKEAKFIQDDVNEQWVKFKTLVTDNRGSIAEEHMQGQLVCGEKAVDANLADALVPDFEAVIAEITK